MVISMAHKGRGEPCNPSGEFELSWPDSPCLLEMGPTRKCMKEANFPHDPSTKDDSQSASFSDYNGLGQRMLVSSGPACPLGFENFRGVDGLSNRAQLQGGPMEFIVCEKSMEDGIEASHSSNVSFGSCSNSTEIVPLTPVFKSSSKFQSGVIEVVLPFEEELAESQNSWNIGKAIGLKVSNELAMIDTLSKVKERQDFTVPRRRGCPRKNKGTIWHA